MNRELLRNAVRQKVRQVNLKPFSDEDLDLCLEEAVDDLSNRVPFAMAVDRASTVRDQREYIMPLDVLEVIEVFYQDAAATLLDGAITALLPADGGDLIVYDTTDFASSGVVLVDDERISYTGKTAASFTGITRGAAGTTAAAHDDNAAAIEPDQRFTRIEPTTTRNVGIDDDTWLENAGVPELYYTFPGILGFDAIPEKSGHFNIVARNFIRPPVMADDTAVVESLLLSFRKAIVLKAAADIAHRLSQDETAASQSLRWLREYLGDVELIERHKANYTRGLEAGYRVGLERITQ